MSYSVAIPLVAQQITAYRYWFDEDFSNAIMVSNNFGSNYSLMQDADVSGLSNGLHVYHVNFKASNNKWSAVSSSFFFKQAITTTGQSQYQYWFDGGSNTATTVNTSPNSNYALITDLDVALLSIGLHTFHIRFRPTGRTWSSTSSSFFYKQELTSSGQAQYQFWFNNQYDQATTANITADSNFEFINNINVEAFSNGLHTFHIRFRPTGGSWSSVSSSFFFKQLPTSSGQALYQYWFDNKFDNAINVSLTSTANLEVLSDINVATLTNGLHVLHIRFKPDGGQWSVVKSDFFFKYPASGITQNRVVKLKYWFDAYNGRIRELVVGSSGTNADLILNIDADGLALGKHYLYGQFLDARGLASNIVVDSFIKTSTTIRLYVYPKISINTSSIVAGSPINVKGSELTPLGLVNVRLLNSISSQLTDTLIYVDNLGKFSINYTNTNVASGEYQVTCFDQTTFFTANPVRLRITNSTVSNTGLIVTAPKAAGNIKAGDRINITWNDFGDGNLTPIGKTAKAHISYKIDRSYNNGVWQLAGLVEKDLLLQRENSFSVEMDLGDEGDYRFKVSRLNDPSRNDLSANIYAKFSEIGFSVINVWDSSGIRMPEGPIGVCADGTSRFYFKVAKSGSNSRGITTVRCLLMDGNISEVRLLGKLQLANTISGYTLEANNASQIEVARASQNTDGNYWFWYVAPDDFARNISDNNLSERTVATRFIVNYSNGTADTLFKDIKVIRPPLLLVHGLNSDPSTWNDFQFAVDGLSFRFLDVHRLNLLYKFPVKALQMDNAGSFQANALTLLNVSDNGVPRSSRIAPLTNSIQYCIQEYRMRYYACNRVDYVGHSMGGCIARSAIAMSPFYNPSPSAKVLQKNYGQGFINKLATINTPHNGSPFADIVDDNYGGQLLQSILQGLNWTAITRDALSGIFVFDNSSFVQSVYSTSAIRDLRTQSGGIRFPKTNVKNHLIAGNADVGTTDCNLKIKELARNDGNIAYKRFIQAKAIFDLYSLYKDVKIIGLFAVNKFIITESLLNLNEYIWKENAVNGLCYGIDVMTEEYGYPGFVNSSDMVVPLSSQLPGVNLNNSLPLHVSLLSGKASMHTNATSNIAAGNIVYDLINRPINSPFFSDMIPANQNHTNNVAGRNSSINSVDSVVNYYDTLKVRIKTPVNNSVFNNDSSINISLKVKDTSGLIKIEGGLLDQVFISYSHAFEQTFTVPLNSQITGKMQIYAKATYDSAGFIVHHMDTTNIIVPLMSSIDRLYTEPSSFDLATQQKIRPNFYGVVDSKYSLISIKDPDLDIQIADTNVVSFSRNSWEFIGKDSGTTYAVASYNGLKDTSYFFVSTPEENNYKACPSSSSIILNANTASVGNSYQWQIDTAGNFENLQNDLNHTGINNASLILTNVPTSWYGRKYRCVVINGNITTNTEPIVITFLMSWIGSVNSEWENAANWNCGQLPDENTDVIININTPNLPVINSDAACRSLQLRSGMITIRNGKQLKVMK